jgi:hypothetical protein
MNDPAPRYIIRRWLDKRLGTEAYLCHPRRGFHLFCITCGSRIPWRALIQRWWRYTACPTCDDYTTYMTEATRTPWQSDCDRTGKQEK